MKNFLSEEAGSIQVVDDGVGISKEDQAHIFERFYRADKMRDRSGVGLGLAIVQWIVTMHHGNIRLDSVLNRGTTFTIVLPKML